MGLRKARLPRTILRRCPSVRRTEPNSQEEPNTERRVTQIVTSLSRKGLTLSIGFVASLRYVLATVSSGSKATRKRNEEARCVRLGG